MPEMRRVIADVDQRLARQSVRFTRNGRVLTHLVTRVYIRSGRLERYPNETLCGKPCSIRESREDCVSAAYCSKCLGAAEKHGLVQFEEIPNA